MGILDFFNKPQQIKQPATTSISSMYTPSNQQVAPTIYHLPNRGAKVTDADFESFKPLLYGEVSNRDFAKKQLEANVIFNTALNRQREYANRGQNKSISEIVAMPNQYQAYGGPQYKEYSNPTNPISAAKKKEVDMIVEAMKEKVKKGDYIDNTEGAYFYSHNPNHTITYDNKRPLFAK